MDSLRAAIVGMAPANTAREGTEALSAHRTCRSVKSVSERVCQECQSLSRVSKVYQSPVSVLGVDTYQLL